MKKSAFSIALLSLWMAFTACEQQESLKAVSQLETLKTIFKKAEPAEFSFKTDAPAEQVKWSVSPNRNVQIYVNGYTAKIHFGEAGRYFVTATDQHIISRTAVTVDTTTYVPDDISTVRPPDEPAINPPIPADTTTITPPVDTVGTHDIILSLKDDEFTLIPSRIDSLNGSGLGISIAGSKSYPCKNSLLSAYGFHRNSKEEPFKLILSHVVQPGARFCQEGEMKISTPNFIIYPIPEGSSKLEVHLNDKVYSGLITREGSTFKINWPYTEGVKFSQLLITK